MTDLSNPLDVMQNRVAITRQQARNLRAEAARLITRAEELEIVSDAIECDARDVEKWMPTDREQNGSTENHQKTGSENG